MIHQFFGLREQPFGVTPDPRYLYLGPGHREALASLFYGVEANRGFLALIANPGMGKTTLLFHLLEKFRHSDRTAFLFQTQCSSRELMRFLLAELGIQSRENDLLGMHEEFNRYLLEQSSAGRRVIVVIDEAQNLDPSVMETVRLLSNFETPRAKLLQIILAGQPQLAIKLARPSLSQLRQRIASFNGLNHLPPQEVAAYIDHRLHVAGHEGPSVFSDSAKALIAGFSEGIPRNINSLCFGALSLGCALRKKHIDAEIVQEVFGDLDLQKFISSRHPNTTRSKTLTSPSIKVPSSPRPHSVSLPKVSVVAAPKPKPGIAVAPAITQAKPEVSKKIGYTIRDTASKPATTTESKATSKRPFRSLFSRVATFAVLVLAVGNGTTKVATPVIKVANTWPSQSFDDTHPASKVKIGEKEAIQPLPAPDPTGYPTVTLQKPAAGSDGMEIKMSAPAVAIANAPIRNPDGLSSQLSAGTERARRASKQREQVDASTEDPAELWQLVKEGSTNAEIRLASLYLEGSVVEQDCKQAHLLLIVASRKGNKLANGLLNSEYTERCHE
jgi:type II secretory pathway predicted ATPase ExeA